MRMRHVYVHVPFCRRRCSYCDFAIAVRARVPARAFVETVGRELGTRSANATTSGASVETVYLGGGTPSLLDPDATSDLMRRLCDVFPLADRAEVTLEANPEDVTATAAVAWRDAGVNRVSLGVQSFDARTLEWMRRPHGPDAPRRAVEQLRAAGIENVSVDLIFAVPDSLRRDWRADLESALALAPSHISLYGLTVEAKTPFGRWVAGGTAFPASDETYAEEYLLAHELLSDQGYAFYEVSSAATPGRWSRHNWAYWSGAPYLGVGPAAHSWNGTERRWNLGPWEAYRRTVDAGEDPMEGREVLLETERWVERVYLGLRTTAGVRIADVGPARADSWVDRGLGAFRGDYVVLSARGWLLLDELVLALTHAPELS